MATAGAQQVDRTKGHSAYVDGLVAQARDLGLARRTMWLRLLHYRGTLTGGYESEADGPPFFLAPEGKTDPEAELEATLRGFFDTKGTYKGLLRHPRCRFPARFMWLHRELGIDTSKLPKVACPELAEYVRRLRPRALVLVFSSYYLNNPASAFGHTFIRVSKAKADADRAGVSLLDYGIDFSATVDTDNSLLYAFKGLMGLFRGDFHRIPFYYKVREYNDFESRDLWEYELELTQEQVDMVVAHVWELGHTYFAYYYLSENCSYHILGALDVADPDFNLTENLGWPVIPADTVKALRDVPGLIRNVYYRPSNRTQFQQRVGVLSNEEREAVHSLMDNPNAALPVGFSEEQVVRVIDTAIDLYDIRLASDLVKDRDEVDAEEAAKQYALLARRTRHSIPSQDHDFEPPFRQMPHVGHDSTQLGLGSGYHELNGYYHLLKFRLALHDLADPGVGYPDTASIEFMPTTLRYDIESPKLKLEHFSLVRVQSLSPLTAFDKSFSWKVDVGIMRDYDDGCEGCPSGFGEMGGGLTLAPFGPSFMLFALAHARVQTPFESGVYDWVRAGFGPSGGMRLRLGDHVTLVGTGAWTYLPEQQPWQTWNIEGKLRIAYFRNFAIGVEGQLWPNNSTLQGVSYLYF
jgi:hypothetical protein